MYKVYVNALLDALPCHTYTLNINSFSLPSPYFVDDISLIPCYSTVLPESFYANVLLLELEVEI